jgi:iron complex transport system permease protein
LAGAIAALAAVLLLAGSRSGPLGLILAGVAVASLAGALTTLALTLAPNPFAQTEIVIWMMGSLADRSLLHVSLAVPLIALGVAILVRSGPDLDTLTLGEEVAHNLGVDLARLRLSIVAGTALAVGAATAVAGGITFVGLIVPHLLRPHLGHRPGPLVLASAFGGAALVVAADIAVRLLAPYADVKLGVLIALVGAPFFLWLVIATLRETAP